MSINQIANLVKIVVEKLFPEKKIKVERILGIIDVVNTLNKKKQFLTNRKTNSSFSFFTPSSKDKLKRFLNKNKFEKLVLKVLNKSILMTGLFIVIAMKYQI